MQFTFAHSPSPSMVEDARAPHSGHWRFELADGTFFFIIRSVHAGTTRMHLANRAPTANVLPGARSSTAIPHAALDSLSKHLESELHPSTTTYDILEKMFTKHGDPMLDPDSAT